MTTKYKAWLAVFALGLLFWFVVCASVAYAAPVKVVRSMTCHSRITPDNRSVNYRLKVSERSDGSIMVNAPFINLEIDQWATNNPGEHHSDGTTADGKLFILTVLPHETTSGKVIYDVHFTYTYDNKYAITAVDCSTSGDWNK